MYVNKISLNISKLLFRGGAYLGETAIRFSIAVGKHGRVYSFDPVIEHIQIINHNRRKNNLENIDILPYGLSNKKHTSPPVTIGKIDGSFNSSRSEIPSVKLDDCIDGHIVTKVDFIKLDIEGEELNALRGSENTIRKFKPKLAISVYHKPEDLYTISKWIENLNLGYKFFIDHHTTIMYESVLYAISSIK